MNNNKDTKNFKSFIRNNISIVKTLFHVDDENITVIDDNTRSITKHYKTSKLFMFIPILKEMLNEILKDISFIQLDIKETFNKKNNEFIYEISLAENTLFENITNLYKFRYYITLNNNKNTNDITSSIYLHKNNVEDDINPINKIIIMIMLNYLENEHPNYYKKVVLEEQLKPLISSISHHSFVLNII